VQLTGLVDMLERRDLILVTGKGGTGKSTLVAALAELAARRRGQAVAVELSAHPQLPRLVSPNSGVRVVHIDAEEVVGETLSRLLHLPSVVGALLRNRIIRIFIRTSPAIREMIALDQLRHLVDGCARDRCPVIVDLPATGHALSFLDTPRAVHRVLRIGPLADVAERVERLLLDGERSELVVISLPEELPINETIELLQRAAAIGVSSRTVIVNQVPSAPLETRDRPLLELLGQQGDKALGRFADAAESECASVEQARAQIDRLRGAVPAVVIELPRYVADDVRDCVRTMVQTLAS
jgi:arsenite/tail-anchored protein-transporting ATPase